MWLLHYQILICKDQHIIGFTVIYIFKFLFKKNLYGSKCDVKAGKLRRVVFEGCFFFSSATK